MTISRRIETFIILFISSYKSKRYESKNLDGLVNEIVNMQILFICQINKIRGNFRLTLISECQILKIRAECSVTETISYTFRRLGLSNKNKRGFEKF